MGEAMDSAGSGCRRVCVCVRQTCTVDRTLVVQSLALYIYFYKAIPQVTLITKQVEESPRFLVDIKLFDFQVASKHRRVRNRGAGPAPGAHYSRAGS